MKKTILVVEDNELNMKLFVTILRIDGYEIVQSLDGSDVLEIANKRDLDLIIMDIQLPGRSGLELTKLLKADGRLKHIPVIAVTAFAMLTDEKTIREAGCDDYITKPISVPEFLATVAEHLAQPAS